MRIIGGSLGPINPAEIHAYSDKLIVWLKEPLTDDEHSSLESECLGRVDRHWNGELVKRKYFDEYVFFPDQSFQQRLQLYQPLRAAIERLSNRNDTHLSYGEFSLDWIFGPIEQREEAYWLVCDHHFKKHRRNGAVKFAKGTRYSDRRKAATNSVLYQDKVSRTTGAPFCLHHDWRIKGIAALRRAKICSVRDLLDLDFRAFWKKRLLLFRVDHARLGRRYHNFFRGTSRRHPWIIEVGNKLKYDRDRSAGSAILRSLGSTQVVIEEYRNRFDVYSCLVQLDVEHLLPASASHDISDVFAITPVTH